MQLKGVDIFELFEREREEDNHCMSRSALAIR